jgi:hypothetical protein
MRNRRRRTMTTKAVLVGTPTMKTVKVKATATTMTTWIEK